MSQYSLTGGGHRAAVNAALVSTAFSTNTPRPQQHLGVASGGDGCKVVATRVPRQLTQAVAMLQIQAAVFPLPPLDHGIFPRRAGASSQLQRGDRRLLSLLIAHTCTR